MGSTGFQLIKKNLPEGRFLEIEYDYKGCVSTFKKPSPLSGDPEITYTFSYGKGFTEATDATGKKRRYVYDAHLQLTAVELYDLNNRLYRVDRKFWSPSDQCAGMLLARAIADGKGNIYSYCSLTYDDRGNVLEEKLYGNLSGSLNEPLQIDEEGKLSNAEAVESYSKRYEYSKDGFNLLTSLSNSDQQKTVYHYQKGCNRVIKKFICQKNKNVRRSFYFYDEDRVCIKSIEDDASSDEERHFDLAHERHIIETSPREEVPGVGFVEVVKEKAVDCKNGHEMLIKKYINTCDWQGHLVSCETYGSDEQYAFTTSKTYNHLGLVTSETDASGGQIIYDYNNCGNRITTSFPHLNKTITYVYDYRNQPIQIIESVEDRQQITSHIFDVLGRKIASTDSLGNTTSFEYDDFGHLTKIIHPPVYDENEVVIQPIFSYTYDIFGHVLSVTDPKNMTTFKRYQLRGQPYATIYPDRTSEFFHYNLDGSLRRTKGRDEIITAFDYDDFGRLIKEQTMKLKEDGKLQDLYRKDYNYKGIRLDEELKELSQSTCFSYDLAGRVMAVIQPNGWKNRDDPDARKTEYIYDSLGRIYQKKSWFDVGPSDYSLECFEYDQAGRVTEQKKLDHLGKTVFQKRFAFDLHGQCIEESASREGVQTTLSKSRYNAWGDLVSSIDAEGKETKIVIDYFHRNALGQTTLKKTIFNTLGTQTEIEFDALARVVSIVKKDLRGTALSHQQILYDALGNKACEINRILSDGKASGEQITRWKYGPMGRLDEEIQSYGTLEQQRIAYSYNAVGKIIAKTIPGFSSPLTYGYDDQWRITKVEYQDAQKERCVLNEYTYDRYGNVKSASSLDPASSYKISVIREYNIYGEVHRETIHDGVEGAAETACEYDRKGRVKSIKLPDESFIRYEYDAFFGRKVSRVSAKGETLYSHSYDMYDDQGFLLRETMPGASGRRESAYDACGRKILSKTDVFTEVVPKGGYNDLGHLLEVGKKADFPIADTAYSYNALSQLTTEKTENTKAYAYDSLDNRIKNDGVDLVCNSLNQLTKSSQAEYTYDAQGNLLRKILSGRIYVRCPRESTA
jgi:YD repeat-containing protein